MKNNPRVPVGFACILLVFSLTRAAEPGATISAASILAHTKVLASDEFEGRGPGSAGEEKTVSYLVSEFKRLGLQPGNPNGTYIQDVQLAGITSKPTLSFNVGGKELVMENVNEFVGPSSRVTEHVQAKDSDVVFVGYGVVAPEYQWDDYKGVDVRGKTVVMLINDPPVPDPKDPSKLDASVFGGKAMTYYGRWTYKYEIAAAKGAAGCLIVHETVPAAYPWEVVRNGRMGEQFTLGGPDNNMSLCPVEGWTTVETAKKIFAMGGVDFEAAK